MVRKIRLYSARQVAHERQDYGTQFDLFTVKGKPSKLGHHARGPSKVPRLTEAMKKKRLGWAMTHTH